MTGEDAHVRINLWFIFVALAVAASYPFFSDFIHSRSLTDDQLRASFVGQAPEDIFGFGFWFLWVIAAVFEAMFLLVAWFLEKTCAFRVAILFAIAIFVITSVLEYVTYTHKFDVWKGVA